MNTLELKIENGRVYVFVDGVPLNEHLFMRGNYSYLTAMDFYNYYKYHNYLSEPYGSGDDSFFIVPILACGCGEVGCWCIEAKVFEESTKVVWVEVEYNEDYPEDGRPKYVEAEIGVRFEFDVDSYMQELEKAKSRKYTG